MNVAILEGIEAGLTRNSRIPNQRAQIRRTRVIARSQFSYSNSVRGRFDCNGSLISRSPLFQFGRAQVVKERLVEVHAQQASCHDKRVGTSMETLSRRITPRFDKIYILSWHIDDSAQRSKRRSNSFFDHKTAIKTAPVRFRMEH